MRYLDLFYLVDDGDGRWIVKHAITDEFAGTIMRTSQGMALRNDESRFLGTYPSVEAALRNLYALV